MCKILVVDDEEDVLELALAHLSQIGHEIYSAQNGEDALQFLEAHESDPPCMILTDLRMPILDGWDLVDALSISIPDGSTCRSSCTPRRSILAPRLPS